MRCCDYSSCPAGFSVRPQLAVFTNDLHPIQLSKYKCKFVLQTKPFGRY
nr:MAG TPA: hypothetical protein [Caudoviricetes sp.]